MADQQVTVRLPAALYQRIKRDAEKRRHSIEDELLDTVAASVTPEPLLPDDLKSAVEQLDLLDSGALQRAARRHMERADARRLETLHLKRQREGLDPDETREMGHLTSLYERIMVVRARAAQLLHQRGHDVSALGPQAPRA
jgi:hypothetical protein